MNDEQAHVSKREEDDPVTPAPSLAAHVGSVWAALAAALMYLLILVAVDEATHHALDLSTLSIPLSASFVLVFFSSSREAARRSWNLLAGHAVAALCAMCLAGSFPRLPPALLSALVLPGAVLAMLATSSLHPPAGITALMFTLSGIRSSPWRALCALLINCLTLVAVRCVLDGVRAALRERASRASGSTGQDG